MMIKKIFLIFSVFTLMFISLTLFAQGGIVQEEGVNETKKVTSKEEMNRKFIKTLAAQDESLLIKAIENGSPEVKALCFDALALKGSESRLIMSTINRHITYGLSFPYETSADMNVRYRAAKAASVTKSDTSVAVLSELLYSDNSISNIIMATYALGEIGSKKGTPALLKQIRTSNNPAVLNEVILALGKIRDTASLNDLLRLAQDDRYSIAVRSSAIDAISNIDISSTDDNETTTTATTEETTAQ